MSCIHVIMLNNSRSRCYVNWIYDQIDILITERRAKRQHGIVYLLYEPTRSHFASLRLINSETKYCLKFIGIMPTQQQKEASAAQANHVIDIFHEISTLLVRAI